MVAVGTVEALVSDTKVQAETEAEVQAQAQAVRRRYKRTPRCIKTRIEQKNPTIPSADKAPASLDSCTMQCKSKLEQITMRGVRKAVVQARTACGDAQDKVV